MNHAIFVDWITVGKSFALECQDRGIGLPVLCRGASVLYDHNGIPRYERAIPATFGASHGTSVKVSSNGVYVSFSGNIGRLSRCDNLFNYGWRETKSKLESFLLDKGLPKLTAEPIPGDFREPLHARVSRLDITANYSTGSESQARAFIRWLSAKSLRRMKKGAAGDESVWWSNGSRMFKAYIKHIELEKHGMKKDHPVYQWCRDNGIVRVELELKRHRLRQFEMNDFEDITQEQIEHIYEHETEILKTVDRSDEPDILDAIPPRYRMTAAAWMGGEDVRTLVSRATLFRHAKILREYGLDILEPRNIVKFPTKVNVIELKPISPPDWYRFDDSYLEERALRLVSNE
ncbi:hypothetical protein Nstercoris_01999 [Nitrosomonas stercoris]|uniref:Replication-associated protein G2P N-terminal domain-containing protein n=1 Tax=Nitrosomonas stercoris TaxID=1444684 RepID=A0A4Y1YNZ8_9PROT|nr:hypothetical protein Nstercoris_01999 [Nitrosomonas stercoris]